MKKNKKWLVAFLMLSSVGNVSADIIEDAKNGLFGEVNKLFRELQKNASQITKEIGNKAKTSYYSAVGKTEIAAMAEEAGAFLEGLAWVRWGGSALFPRSDQGADDMYKNIKSAVRQWKNTLIDQGISKSSDANIQLFKGMGYDIAVNDINRTVIKKNSDSSQWLKSPWGWLPYSIDKGSVISNDEEKKGEKVSFEEINEAIASGVVVPLIWIKEKETMVPLSRENFDRLVENNLTPFMPRQADNSNVSSDTEKATSSASA